MLSFYRRARSRYSRRHTLESRSSQIAALRLAVVAGSLLLAGTDLALNDLLRRYVGTIPVVLAGGVAARVSYNRDLAFGAGHSLPSWVAVGVGAVLVAVVAAWAWKVTPHAKPAEMAAAPLLLGGGLGNLLDRATDGFVTDVHLNGWPGVNLADLAIVAGAVVFANATRRARGPA